MNLCKERLNQRTKSLREKFCKNRSYSELSLKDVPTPASLQSTIATIDTGNPSGSGYYYSSMNNNNNNKMKKFNPIAAGTTSTENTTNNNFIRRKQLPPSVVVDHQDYSSLISGPEDSYGSGLDLTETLMEPLPLSSSQQQHLNNNNNDYLQVLDIGSGGNSRGSVNFDLGSVGSLIDPEETNFDQQQQRFHWQQDIAIQCNLLGGPLSSTGSNNNQPSNTVGSVGRFWKSSTSITTGGSGGSGSGSGGNHNNRFSFNRKSFRWPITGGTASGGGGGGSGGFQKQPRSSPQLLKRAASFNNCVVGGGGVGYSRLIQNNDDSTQNSSPSSSPENPLPSKEMQQQQQQQPKRPTTLLGCCATSAAITACAPISSPTTTTTTKKSSKTSTESNNNNNDDGILKSKPSNLDHDNNGDDGDANSNQSSTQNKKETEAEAEDNNELYNFDTVHRLLNISLQAENSLKNRKEFKQQLLLQKKHCGTSGNNLKTFMMLDLPNPTTSNTNTNNNTNLNNPNDNSNHKSRSFMNLPSPNIQSEIQEINPVLRKLSALSRSPERILSFKNNQNNRNNNNKKINHSNSLRVLKIGSNRSKILNKNIKNNFNNRNNHNNNQDDDDYLDDFYLNYDYNDDDDFIDEDLNDDEPPPDEQLLKLRPRRRALIPPKLLTDDQDDITTSQITLSGGSKSNSTTDLIDLDSNTVVPAAAAATPTASGSGSAAAKMDTLHVNPDQDHHHHHHHHNQQNNPSGTNSASPTSPSTNSGSSNGSGSVISCGGGSGNAGGTETGIGNQNNRKNRRRSSIVVIPPMQICPGDLLVYSKVLAQRANLIEQQGCSSGIGGSGGSGSGIGGFNSRFLNSNHNQYFNSNSNSNQSNRKSKNTWSLLRLFDRSNSRQKLEQILNGLEEFLSNLQPFNTILDETMLSFKDITLDEFITKIIEKHLKQSKEHLNQQCSTSKTIIRKLSEEDNELSGLNDLVGTNEIAAATTLAATAADLIEDNVAKPVSVSGPVSRFLNGNRFNSLQTNTVFSDQQQQLDSGTGNETPKMNKHLQQQQQQQRCPICNRLSTSLLLNKNHSYSLERPSIQNPSIESNSNRLNRTESINTESEVESLLLEDEEDFDKKSSTTTSTQASLIQAGQIQIQQQKKLDPEKFCNECYKFFKREKHRQETLWELFQFELHFLIDHLLVLKNVFLEPLKNIQVEGYAMYAEPEVLFGNLDELLQLIYLFCKEFLKFLKKQILQAWNEQQQQLGIMDQSTKPKVLLPQPEITIKIGKLLEQLYLKNFQLTESITQAFHRYTLNYINALQYLETLRRQVEFIEFEKWCNRDPRCKKLQLTDLLVTPVQHVMRIPLLLKEIECKTQNLDEKRIINKIIELQQNSLKELDDKMRWLKNFERLLIIQRNIIWPTVLDMEPKIFIPEFLKSFLSKQPCEKLIVSPRRQIILEGSLMLLDSGKPVEMYVFLFDDLLLITKRKKGLGKKQSTLTERWVSNCGGGSGNSGSGSSGNTGSNNNSGTAGVIRTSSLSSVIGSPAATGGSGGSGSGLGGMASPVNVAAAAAVATATAAVVSNHHSTSIVGGAGTSQPIGTTSTTTAAASTSVTAATIPNVLGLGEPNHGPVTSGPMINGPFKYVVYKQPLSLDRFYIHDVPQYSDGSGNNNGSGSSGNTGTGADGNNSGNSGSSSGGGGCSGNNSSNLRNGFSLVCLNRFQQVITVHTFQAASESAKNTWLVKLRTTCDRWKSLLQSNNAIRYGNGNTTGGGGSGSGSGSGNKTTTQPMTTTNNQSNKTKHRSEKSKTTTTPTTTNNEQQSLESKKLDSTNEITKNHKNNIRQRSGTVGSCCSSSGSGIGRSGSALQQQQQQLPLQQQLFSFDSMNSITPSLSYHLDDDDDFNINNINTTKNNNDNDSQITRSTFT